MAKIQLGVIFGSRTCEHEVSIISAVQLMKSVDLEKCLRLINFYVENKPEEKIKTLTELLNLLNII